MRIAPAVAALVLLTVPAGWAVAPRQHHPYRSHWKRQTFGKGALARVAAGAGINQIRHHPREFGGGAAGFGKRAGFGFATHSVKTTVEHLVAAPLHEDLH